MQSISFSTTFDSGLTIALTYKLEWSLDTLNSVDDTGYNTLSVKKVMNTI